MTDEARAQLKKLAHSYGLNDVPCAVDFGVECFAAGAAAARKEDEQIVHHECAVWGHAGYIEMRIVEAIRAQEEKQG